MAQLQEILSQIYGLAITIELVNKQPIKGISLNKQLQKDHRNHETAKM